ncbi:MAG TPA: transglutaminase domain-containing protein [Phnomibacter sp.]|nr:transglutaminase domain-containing protein [Phnomibacter sp.]
MKRKLFKCLLLICSTLAVFAQEKTDVKFGKVTAEDFKPTDNPLEKNAAAVYIADIGFTEFRGNTKGWFSLYFERKTRIKVNDANGIDAADFRILLFNSGTNVEKLTKLNASSYNLENGQVVETKLKSDQVFSDKYSRRLDIKKFSVPGAKAGSIIEVSYVIESDFLQNLQPWEFQGKYPRLWSQYEVGFPEYFNYVTLTQGYHPLHLKKSNIKRQQYRVMVSADGTASGRSETVALDGEVEYVKWVMKDVPALREESYTSSIENHLSKVEFQLNQIKLPNQMPRPVMNQWPQVVKEYNEWDKFGLTLYRNNGWLNDETQSVVAGANTEEEKAKRIYNYLRDKYTCTSSGGYTLTNTLRDVVKQKSGSVGDINLLLVAMLNHENIKCYPVILSTRRNGLTHEFYPLMDRFNYVVAEATINGKPVYLDATQPSLPFGTLPLHCYNGHARVMNEYGTPVYFMPDSIAEKKTVIIFLATDSAGKWGGTYKSKLGTYESVSTLQMLKQKGPGALRQEVLHHFPAETVIDSIKVQTTENATGQQVELNCEFALNSIEDEEIIYLNPILGEGLKDNPFKSEKRLYPVEMPYALSETLFCNIAIPEGYVVEEIPKSTKVNLFEQDGFFEYIVQNQPDMIALRSRLVINKADFTAEDYESLREFFSYVVKKHSESVVIKKKK